MNLKEIEEKFDKVIIDYNIPELVIGVDDIDFSISDIDLMFDIRNNTKKDEKAGFLETIKHLYHYPIMNLHESWHYLSARMLFIKPLGFYVSSPFNKNMNGAVYFDMEEIDWRMLIVTLAPFLSIILALVLPFLNIYFLIFTIYSITTIKHSIPSGCDFKDFFVHLMYRNKYKETELNYFMDIVSEKLTLKEIYKEYKLKK